MTMLYPTIKQYLDALRLAEDNFDQLAAYRLVTGADGNPVMSSGNFAVVFKMQDICDGSFHAVKCFLKDQPGRAEAYHLIAEELEQVTSSYLAHIRFLERELFVDTGNGGAEYPVLVMDWVEGITLDRYLRQHLSDPHALGMLAYHFARLGAWLLTQPFAHGDLKSDNILVRPDGTLVLVDYDGMYVPTMQGQKALETGTPDFRHPLRTDADFNEHIDDFPLASILLSLRAVAYCPDYLDRYGASDRLLLSEADYLSPEQSAFLRDEFPTPNAELNRIYALFLLALSERTLSQVSFRLFNLAKPLSSAQMPNVGTPLGLHPKPLVKTNPELPNGLLSWTNLQDLQNILEASVVPKGILPGLFTINRHGDKVSFAKGNLQYQVNTGTWRFAEHQWDYEGAAKIRIGVTNSDWIDLFGWGTGNNPTPAIEDYEDYSYYSTFVDWGKNSISNGSDTPNLWRTLTIDEWEYILLDRADANAKMATGSIDGVHGLILLPDSWTLPSECSFNSGINRWDNNRYTLSEWVMMEAAGAVFLPAAGFRWGTKVYSMDFDGYYWSSTPGDEYNACYVYFGSGNAYTYFDYRNRVQSVRLVRDIKILKQ